MFLKLTTAQFYDSNTEGSFTETDFVIESLPSKHSL